MSYFEVTPDIVRVVGDESIEDEINACYIIFDSKLPHAKAVRLLAAFDLSPLPL